MEPTPQYDPARRRRSTRKQRERGAWIYVSQDELRRAGWEDGSPPPFYRVWGSSRGGLFIRLYKGA